jgi:hypothetical protein
MNVLPLTSSCREGTERARVTLLSVTSGGRPLETTCHKLLAGCLHLERAVAAVRSEAEGVLFGARPRVAFARLRAVQVHEIRRTNHCSRTHTRDGKVFQERAPPPQHVAAGEERAVVGLRCRLALYDDGCVLKGDLLHRLLAVLRGGAEL